MTHLPPRPSVGQRDANGHVIWIVAYAAVMVAVFALQGDGFTAQILGPAPFTGG